MTKIEKVQRRFFLMIAHKINLAGYPTSVIERQCSMNSLQSRRNFIDILFVHRLLNGSIDCPDLLQKIYFNVPQ
ncbi:Hypothetical protein CINCED_3A013113, partial [Cinara cedri]